MPNPHSIKPCITHAWTSSTANGWRVCPTCKQAQRLVDGEWTVLPTPVVHNTKAQKPRKIKEGYYADFRKADSNIRTYWGW